MRRTFVVLTTLALLVAGACSSGDDDEGAGILGGVEGSGQEGGGQEDGGDIFGGEEGGGGGGGGYTDATESNFMGVCTSYPGADDDVCSCAWDNITEDVPYEDYQDFEDDYLSDPSSTPLPGWLESAVSSCS